MRRLRPVLVAALATAGILAIPAQAAAPSLSVRVVQGPSIDLAAWEVTELGAYDLQCPGGYVATGFGIANGANDVVIADVNPDGRSYTFSFANGSDGGPYGASASIICARASSGGKRIELRTALSQAQREQAIADARAAMR